MGIGLKYILAYVTITNRMCYSASEGAAYVVTFWCGEPCSKCILAVGKMNCLALDITHT